MVKNIRVWEEMLNIPGGINKIIFCDITTKKERLIAKDYGSNLEGNRFAFNGSALADFNLRMKEINNLKKDRKLMEMKSIKYKK